MVLLMLVPASAIGLVVYSSDTCGGRRARAARDADGTGHEAAAAEALLRRGASRGWVAARRGPLKTAAGRELGSGSDLGTH